MEFSYLRFSTRGFMVSKSSGNMQIDQAMPGQALREIGSLSSGQSSGTSANSTSAAITGASAEGIQAYDALRVTMTALNDQLLRTQATAGIVTADIRTIYEISAAVIQVQTDPTLSGATGATKLMFLHSQPGSAEQLRAINYQQTRLDALISNVIDDSDLARLGRAAQQTMRAVERVELSVQSPGLDQLKQSLVEIKKYALAPTSTADVEKALAATEKLCANFQKISEVIEASALKLQADAPSQAVVDYSRILERLGNSAGDAIATATMLERTGVTKAEFRDTVKLLLRSELPNEQIREALSKPATYKLATLDEIVAAQSVDKVPEVKPQSQLEQKVIQLDESQVVAETTRVQRMVAAARDSVAYAFKVLSAPVVALNLAVSMVRSANAGSISYGEFSAKVTSLGYSVDSPLFKELSKLLAKWHVIDSTLEAESFEQAPMTGQLLATAGGPRYQLALVGDGDSDSSDDQDRPRKVA